MNQFPKKKKAKEIWVKVKYYFILILFSMEFFAHMSFTFYKISEIRFFTFNIKYVLINKYIPEKTDQNYFTE